MRGSGFIVALNTDPAAAIFHTADVCIVEDLRTFIPAFIEAYERERDN
jgi:electron transfer flavoprotein alpha subunit